LPHPETAVTRRLFRTTAVFVLTCCYTEFRTVVNLYGGLKAIEK